MTYYPLSQIHPNLYTNGGEYILSNTKENYKGYYYKLSTGKKYTGKTPQDGPNILLLSSLFKPNLDPINEFSNLSNNFATIISLTSDNEGIVRSSNINNLNYNINYDTNINYTQLKSPSLPRLIPYFNPTIPNQKDKNLGAYTRYFCKKTNELKYIEINKDIHDKLFNKSNLVAWDLYIPISTLWYIKGSKENIYRANKGLIDLIEQEQKWYGFSQYFKEDFLKYYQSLDISNLYTSGGEFKTKNGQEYIGFYHIHNGTIPMVGKNHIKESHETLIPVVKPKPLTQTTSSVVITTAPTPPTTSGGGGSYGGGGGGSY